MIKTVVAYVPPDFDKKVNDLLETGWTLKKRDVIAVQGEPNEAGSRPVFSAFYAELEK